MVAVEGGVWVTGKSSGEKLRCDALAVEECLEALGSDIGIVRPRSLLNC